MNPLFPANPIKADTWYWDGIDVRRLPGPTATGLVLRSTAAKSFGWGALDNTYLTNRTRNLHDTLPLGNFVAIGGTPALGQVGSDASVLNKSSAWAFDGAADETIQYQGLIPFEQDDTFAAITVRLHWAPSDGTAGNVYWRVTYAFIDTNDQIDEAVSTVNIQTATPAVADQRTTSDLVLAAHASGDFLLKLNISRLGADALDTYNGLDAWLLAVQPLYGADS